MKEKIIKSKHDAWTAIRFDGSSYESRKEIILEAECNGVKYAVGDTVIGKAGKPFVITELYLSYDKEHILAGPKNIGIRKVWHVIDSPQAKPCDYDGRYPSWLKLCYQLMDIEWKPYISEKPTGTFQGFTNMLNNLKTNEMESMKVNAPEGYVIDTEKSTTTEVFFKKKDDRPRKWSDINLINGYYISDDTNIRGCLEDSRNSNKNVWPTKELAEAALALSELMQYRQRWIGEWKPNWDECRMKYIVCVFKNNVTVDGVGYRHHSLTFPTREMGDDFLETFRELIETAKPLL